MIAGFLFFAIILFPFYSFSQDTIKLKTGKVIDASIIKVTNKEVQYKKNNSDSMYVVKMKEVYSYVMKGQNEQKQKQFAGTLVLC